jgi:hypothetical protein
VHTLSAQGVMRRCIVYRMKSKNAHKVRQSQAKRSPAAFLR